MDVSRQAAEPCPKKKYLGCSSKSIPCPQVLGYTLGKTLGSGNYAKVKAAWSPFERKMVSKTKFTKEFK